MEERNQFQNNKVFRWVLGIIILAVVFWLGFRLGEVKAIIGGSGPAGYFRAPMMGNGYYGYGGRNFMHNMMNPGYFGNYAPDQDYYYGYGPGMMRGFYNFPFQTTTTPR